MTSNGIIPFSFEDHPMRVSDENGEPWFVLVDVCGVLDISKHRDAASRLDDDERGSVIVDTPGGPQPTITINESGLWSLVLTSRKPSAKRFKKWITSEVIPAIRKSGGYMVASPDETPEQLAIRALEVLQATVERQKVQLALVQPKADALDLISAGEGSLTLTQAAKMLGINRAKMTKWMNVNGWVYRQNGSWVAYKQHIRNGRLEYKEHSYTSKTTGAIHTTEYCHVTQKGLAHLAEVFSDRKNAA